MVDGTTWRSMCDSSGPHLKNSPNVWCGLSSDNSLSGE
jgi:hypothetical protein